MYRPDALDYRTETTACNCFQRFFVIVTGQGYGLQDALPSWRRRFCSLPVFRRNQQPQTSNVLSPRLVDGEQQRRNERGRTNREHRECFGSNHVQTPRSVFTKINCEISKTWNVIVRVTETHAIRLTWALLKRNNQLAWQIFKQFIFKTSFIVVIQNRL